MSRRPRRSAAWTLACGVCLGLALLGAALAQDGGPPPAGAAPAPAAPETATAAPRAGDDQFQAIFQAGNQRYLTGDYAGAVAEYRKLLDAGLVHPDVYFNLGNASYRAGAKGMAVLAYERALALEPGDAAVASNLAAVRRELVDRVVMPGDGGVGEPLWHGFIRGLSLGRLTWLCLGLYWLGFGLLIARRLLAEGLLRRLLFWVNVPVLSLVVVLGGLLGSRVWLEERVHHAVVVAAAAPLREGPERSAKALMEIHEGLKVRLLSQVGDHVRVRLENGVEGFLLESQIGKI
ncbi:MAG TPA: tetratricopeptide repeat protein [Myxococcota bacterium]|nr:tetratricopeptide repeat protein [Myxococcota bacterium]HRY94298.1 tetratricopeptide repeat protein [Myxococcota bacterium]